MSIENPTNIDYAIAAVVGAAGATGLNSLSPAPTLLNQPTAVTLGEAGIAAAAVSLLSGRKDTLGGKLAGAMGIGALAASWWLINFGSLTPTPIKPVAGLPPVPAGSPL
jgi:hypothetical protein